MKLNLKPLFAAACIFILLSASSQKKIVILGSSTAAGIGATPISNSWANLYSSYLRSIDTSTTVVNLAIGGFVTYDILPTGTTPPVNRPSPSLKNNITAALAENPTVIIVSLTSNDAANNYSLSETQNNLIRVVEVTRAAGIKTYITTTAPRNLDTNQRNLQMLTRDWITNYFGVYAIDFWSSLGNADATVKAEYQYEDGIHFNNKGHSILFERVKSKGVLNGATLPLNFRDVKAYQGRDGIHLEWRVLTENSRSFNIERSEDGINFSQVGTMPSLNNSQQLFSWIDKGSIAGKSWYRIACIDRDNMKVFSGVVSVTSEKRTGNFYIFPNPIKNTLNINFTDFSPGNYRVRLISENGQQFFKNINLSSSVSLLTLPVKNFASGLLEIQVIDKKTIISKLAIKN